MRTFRSECSFFVALMATALAMGAALAHLLELPNKIGLERDAYLVVQQIYRGWNLLALLLVVELVSMIVLAWQSRRQGPLFSYVVAAIVCLLAAQAVFWTFTYPANVATSSWTVLPADWESLRRQWEYSHAVGAVLQTVAMAALVLAALARRRGSEGNSLVEI